MITRNSPENQIKAWQSFLAGQGITPVSTDGRWGPETESATKTFQASNKLNPDGIIGPDTLTVAGNMGFLLPSPSAFPPEGLLDAVFDISHHNATVNLAKAKSAGMMAVFHKATQSVGATRMHDKLFPSRKNEALAAGLLWGAYHFGSGGSGKDQAMAFLAYVQPNKDTLLALDFEPNTTAGETTMNPQEAAEFVQEIYKQTGTFPGLYSGNLLNESSTSPGYDVLKNCWLWKAQYGREVHLPPGWSDFTLWQYTDGNSGPSALPVDGVGQCDREVFKGSREELEIFWAKNKV